MSPIQTEHLNMEAQELSYRDLFNILLKQRWLFLSISALVSISVLVYSLLLPDLYQSKALLNPVTDDSNMSSASKTLSSNLVSFAGISLPQNSSHNSIKAIDKITTLSFFEESILPNIFLPDLMAIQSWEKSTNTILYDDTIYNSESESWISKPSSQSSYKMFKKLLNVSDDKNTGFVSISIKHQSPYIAQTWTDLVVREINMFFRIKDKAESQAAMNYLNRQMMQTNFAEIKQVIAQLLQQKTQRLMLLEASEFYVFEYIDPPAAMESKHEPSRLFICIIGFIFGIFISAFVVFARYFLNND